MVEQRWMRCGVRCQCNSAVSSSPPRVDRWCASPNGRSGRDNCPKQLHCPAQQSLQSFAPSFSHLPLATRPASKKKTMMLHIKFPNLDNSSDRNGYAVRVASVQSERTAEPDRQSDSCRTDSRTHDNCADCDTVLALLCHCCGELRCSHLIVVC